MAVSEHGKQAIAQEVAFGIDKAQIAKARGLTANGLAMMVAKPEMQAMIEDERKMLATRMSMAMVHLSNQVEKSVQNIVSIANNLEHKDAYRANMDIIGMFKAPKQETEQRIEVNIKTEVINTIVGELDKMMTVHSKFDPERRLMTGAQARVHAFGDNPEQHLIDSLIDRNVVDE